MKNQAIRMQKKLAMGQPANTGAGSGKKVALAKGGKASKKGKKC